MTHHDLALSMEGVSKSFGNKFVLEDINLDVSKGEIIYIIGKSGAGKSILLKTLIGLLRADQGKITIEGHSISSLDVYAWQALRKKIGMVFQMGALFDSINVYNNIAFMLKRFSDKSEEEIQDIVVSKLRMVGLSDIGHLYPSSLSFGMQKRVSVARAIAGAPSILLYDEPTTGVDPISAQAINDLIVHLSQELRVTTLVISHDLPSAIKIANRIAMLYMGKFIIVDTPANFIRDQHPAIKEFLKAI